MSRWVENKGRSDAACPVRQGVTHTHTQGLVLKVLLHAWCPPGDVEADAVPCCQQSNAGDRNQATDEINTVFSSGKCHGEKSITK